MIRLPPGSQLTASLFPYTTLFRSVLVRRLRRCGGVPEGQVQDQRQRHRLLLALQERRKSRAFALLLQERLWREAQAGPGLALRPDAARNRATPSHEWRRRAGIGPL